MNNVLRKKIRIAIQPQMAAAFASLSGKYSLTAYAERIDDALQALDLNDYRPELAYSLAREDDHKRSSSAMPRQLDLLTPELAESIVIPLGGGQRVKLIDAHWRDLRMKQQHQIETISRVTDSARNTSQLMNDLASEMESSPDTSVRDAMIRLGQWQASAVSTPSAYLSVVPPASPA